MNVKELVVKDMEVTPLKSQGDLCECVHDYSLIMDFGRLRLCVKCGKLYSELGYHIVRGERPPAFVASKLCIAYIVDDDTVVIVK